MKFIFLKLRKRRCERLTLMHLFALKYIFLFAAIKRCASLCCGLLWLYLTISKISASVRLDCFVRDEAEPTVRSIVSRHIVFYPCMADTVTVAFAFVRSCWVDVHVCLLIWVIVLITHKISVSLRLLLFTFTRVTHARHLHEAIASLRL